MTAKPTGVRVSASGSDSEAAFTVELLEATAAGDRDLVDRLTSLLNRVYAAAEKGLWREQATRTSAAELAEHIRAGEIAVAKTHEEIVGCRPNLGGERRQERVRAARDRPRTPRPRRRNRARLLRRAAQP
ncbi:MAG: hypothetical protein JO304_10850 [Solirubrobacterales bacterium]|nr:hypothetical protein [Solirubrobacterales bacterium]